MLGMSKVPGLNLAFPIKVSQAEDIYEDLWIGVASPIPLLT